MKREIRKMGDSSNASSSPDSSQHYWHLLFLSFKGALELWKYCAEMVMKISRLSYSFPG